MFVYSLNALLWNIVHMNLLKRYNGLYNKKEGVSK